MMKICKMMIPYVLHFFLITNRLTDSIHYFKVLCTNGKLLYLPGRDRFDFLECFRESQIRNPARDTRSITSPIQRQSISHFWDEAVKITFILVFSGVLQSCKSNRNMMNTGKRRQIMSGMCTKQISTEKLRKRKAYTKSEPKQSPNYCDVDFTFQIIRRLLYFHSFSNWQETITITRLLENPIMITIVRIKPQVQSITSEIVIDPRLPAPAPDPGGSRGRLTSPLSSNRRPLSGRTSSSPDGTPPPPSSSHRTQQTGCKRRHVAH